MPSYLVETYLERDAAVERRARELRARSAAAGLTREGTRVTFHGSTYVPEDEMCFYAFSAPSAGDAVQVARRAGLEAVRVVEAISSGKE